MKTSTIFGVALALGLSLSGFAQTSATTRRIILELRLESELNQDKTPQTLTVLIVNKGDHDVRLPVPSIACDDIPYGTVALHFRFKPIMKSTNLLEGGCINDYGYTPILDRLKGWKVLGPGESLSLMTKHVLAQDAGAYEYWASYIFPGMPQADEDVLQNAGIDFPKSTLESSHLSFTRAR